MYKIGMLPNLYAYNYEFFNNFTKRTNLASSQFCTYKFGWLPILYVQNWQVAKFVRLKYEFLTISQSVQIWQVVKFVRTN